MSTYFLVHLQLPTAPDHLAEAHASGTLFLNARGRACEAARAAKLESEELARALLTACAAPLASRYGDGVSMEVRRASVDGADDAQQIANDSNDTRLWLASQPA